MKHKRTPRLYEQVVTHLSEQGFVHAVKADGSLEVKLLRDDSKQFIREVKACEVDKITVISDVPKREDLTPFGIVHSACVVAEGIAAVVMCNQVQMIWLSCDRLRNLPNDYKEIYAHWAEIEDMAYLLEHYDLMCGSEYALINFLPIIQGESYPQNRRTDG